MKYLIYPIFALSLIFASCSAPDTTVDSPKVKKVKKRTNKKPEIEESEVGNYESKDTHSGVSNILNDDCRANFSYEGDKITYYGFYCSELEKLFVNYAKNSRDGKAASLDMTWDKLKLEPYLKKMYGCSSIDDAVDNYTKTGHIFASSKPLSVPRLIDSFKPAMDNNWTASDKENFIKDCKRGLSDSRSKLNSNERQQYCNCMIEKIIIKFPNKYSEQDIDWLLKNSKECP